MAMRASKNNAKGASGQSYVKAQLEELRWGAVLNPEHDLGTDIWAAARDPRGFDLGAVIGVQVKNWDFPFDKPKTHRGVKGWWFDDTADHFDYWLNHRLPHLVALYDKAAQRTHWVHVTKEAVISTGKRRKIFVPKGQTIDESHIDDLIEIATRNPPGTAWEGSAWVPGQVISEEAQWRYAMIAPRLIAPHPNATTEESSAPQAMAMLTALRLDDIHHRYKEKQPLLDRKASLESDDLGWRLFGSTIAWVEDGDLSGLRQFAHQDIDEPFLRVAAAISLSAALYEDGEVAESVSLLNQVMGNYDDYTPVDLAWLKVHLARNLVQNGQLLQARDLALEVVPIGQIASSDPTARLIAGVASDIIFSMSGWQSGDLAATIQARDTVAAWWRSQAMTSGLTKHLEESFKTWAKDQSVTWGGSDGTWLKLRSATLISGFAADTPNWAYESSLLAQHILMLELTPDQVSSALNLLRLSGSEKELKLAVNRVLDRGPVEALTVVSSSIDLEKSTRSSLFCDLETLGLSGPLLSMEVADVTASWILAELRNPDVRAKALGLRFAYTEHLVRTLARIYVTCTSVMQQEIRAHIVALPEVENQSIAHNYAILVRNVEHSDWTPEQISQIKQRNAADNFELRDELELTVAACDPDFRTSLADRITQGDVTALSSWGDVRDLPATAAAGMIEHTAAAVLRELESARSGSFAFGANSVVRRLVLLNVWHPQAANWEPCVEAISDIASSPNDLSPALQFMAMQAGMVPDEIASSLKEPLRRLAYSSPDSRFEDGWLGVSDLRGDAIALLAAFFPDEVSDEVLLEWLRGSPVQVAAAVGVFASREMPTDLPLLAALAMSDETEVRAAVVSALARWTTKGLGGSPVFRLLNSMLSEPGVKLALRVTRTLAQQDQTEAAEKLLEILETHQSSIVRRHVELIRRRWLDRT